MVVVLLPNKSSVATEAAPPSPHREKNRTLVSSKSLLRRVPVRVK
jgi:hypothetical protein